MEGNDATDSPSAGRVLGGFFLEVGCVEAQLYTGF